MEAVLKFGVGLRMMGMTETRNEGQFNTRVMTARHIFPPKQVVSVHVHPAMLLFVLNLGLSSSSSLSLAGIALVNGPIKVHNR
jgi:hypothetical protein